MVATWPLPGATMGSGIDDGGAMPMDIDIPMGIDGFAEAEILLDDEGPNPRSLASISFASWAVVGAAAARASRAEYRSSLEAMMFDVAAPVPERDIDPIPDARSCCMGGCIIDIIGLLLLLLL